MTDDIPLTLRVRRLVSDWVPVVVAGPLFVTLLAGVGTYSTYASTEYETEEIVVSSLNDSTEFDHSAVVRNDSTLWTEGETARDRPLYYTRLMPVLDVNYIYAYDLTGDVESGQGEVTARTDAQLIIRAADEDGATLWRNVRPMASGTTESLAPGERHTATIQVNATQVAQRIGRIESNLGTAAGNVRVTVRTRTAVNGSVAGQDISRDHTSELPLVVRPPTYRVDGPQTVAAGTQLQTETAREVVEPSLLRRVGAPVGLLFGLVALAGLAYGSRTRVIELTEAERERCLLAEKRKQFDEWITRGDIPGVDQYQTVVQVSTLSGLVDLAIDTNDRVIEDEGAFYVLRGREDVAHVYAPSSSSVYGWLFGGFDLDSPGGGSFPEVETAGNGDQGSGADGLDVGSLFDDDGFAGERPAAGEGDGADLFNWQEDAGDEGTETDAPRPGDESDAGVGDDDADSQRE